MKIYDHGAGLDIFVSKKDWLSIDYNFDGSLSFGISREEEAATVAIVIPQPSVLPLVRWVIGHMSKILVKTPAYQDCYGG